MLGDDLLVDFIELNKVRPAQREVFEELSALVLATHEVGTCVILRVERLPLRESLSDQGAGDSATLERVVVVLLRY